MAVVKTYTDAERKRAIKRERERAEAVEREFATAYACPSTHKPVVREAVEYYVRKADELEEAAKVREAAAAAAAATTAKADSTKAKAAIAKAGCAVSFEEWSLLKMAMGGGEAEPYSIISSEGVSRRASRTEQC